MKPNELSLKPKSTVKNVWPRMNNVPAPIKQEEIEKAIKQSKIKNSNKIFFNKNTVVLKKLGRINSIFLKDQKKSSATLVISGELYKLYFDQTVDLNLIKENLLKRKTKFQDDLNKISEKLSNKAFVNKAPKNIVDQEKTNYNLLKNDIQKVQLTIESL